MVPGPSGGVDTCHSHAPLDKPDMLVVWRTVAGGRVIVIMVYLSMLERLTKQCMLSIVKATF